MSDKKQNKQKENKISQIAKEEAVVLDFWDKAEIFVGLWRW